MEELRVRIIDARVDFNKGCSVEAFVNSEIKYISLLQGVSQIKLSCHGPDYFVIQYKINLVDEDVPP